jgi:hypothetical protein
MRTRVSWPGSHKELRIALSSPELWGVLQKWQHLGITSSCLSHQMGPSWDIILDCSTLLDKCLDCTCRSLET